MGDRANIIVKNRDEQVVLYSHWNGSELPQTLAAALKWGDDRWTDFQYLTRIIFCEMVAGDDRWTSGYGITNKVYNTDDPSRDITVNVDSQTIHFNDVIYSFESFIESVNEDFEDDANKIGETVFVNRKTQSVYFEDGRQMSIPEYVNYLVFVFCGKV